jgi:hypothetical protein
MDAMAEVKIRICLHGIEHAKSEKRRDYWRNTLSVWDERARAQGFKDAADWYAKARAAP